jgi:DNA-binding SARP family transcriptional activator
MGLLAILGLGGKRGVARDRIKAYLWPERSAASAGHTLDQVVYAIRQALGSDSILSTGGELRLNPELIRVDTWEFEEAIHASQWATAVGHYKGPLLDGFHVADSRELEACIDTERARLLREYQTAIERLAELSAEAGDHSQSVIWWRRLANSDPLSPGPAKKLILALAGAGDRAGAVKHARHYQELVRQELEMEPDSEIENLASTLSHSGTAETAGTIPRRPPTVAVPSPSETPWEPRKSLGETDSRDVSARRPPRMKRSRTAAILSFAVLIVMLVGAVTVENRQRQARLPSLAENTVRNKSRIASPPARESYLRALDAWSDGSKEGLDNAVAYFHRATELDPGYAEAYAGLADAYIMLGYFGYRPSDAMFPKGKEAALRSIQLDGTLASAHPALAYELTWERDFARADSEFRKAIEPDPTHTTLQAVASDPTYAMAHQWYAILLMILSQKPEAVGASGRVATRDPFSLNVPVIEVSFTKWITTYPTMAGFTSNGAGTMAGQILSRIDDGVSTRLIARYEVTDSSGTHAFKAVTQGEANNKTGKYELNGIVTWGWMIGAHVRVNFQRITPCQFGKLNVCYQGTIQIQRG